MGFEKLFALLRMGVCFEGVDDDVVRSEFWELLEIGRPGVNKI
jgi:hypothetical protein